MLSVALVTGVIAERSRRRSVQIAVFRDADQLRSTLLNLVSHNLRTPLATIKTSLSAVKSTAPLPADSMQLIDDAMQACNRLNRLVTNTLRIMRN
ncbi:MAG: histidine kinase dimerization/phospho-acceptor domain-containing protein [Anaerolineae bacterium]